MKIGAGLLLASTVVFSGCSGFWDPPANSGGGGGTTPTTLSSGVFYVVNETTKQLVGYSINSGTLGAISGGTETFLAAPSCIAIAPSGGFLYVGTTGGIYMYSIGSSGALTAGSNGGIFNSGELPAAMEVDPSDSWLIAAYINGSNQVELDAIPISATNGSYIGAPGAALPSQAFSIANATVKQIAISRDGANVFVALGTGGTIVVPFNSGNSNPLGATARTIAPQTSGGSALSVAVDPTTRFFYIGETLVNSSATPGGLRVFSYSSLSSGTLAQITGSPIASGGLSPNAILPLGSGDFVYVANGQGPTTAGNIAWFSLSASGSTYTIAAGKTIGAGIQPMGLAEDNTKAFVLAVSTGGSTTSGNPDLDAYTISSGALTLAVKSVTGTDPVGAVAVAAVPK
ncbi:conserved exported hypothetical protein [Candidatus Sulfotelmatomonas gaucii]|uniref:Lipoprotein n=1 Tax=Candidatus Sulfuritelmatomonas gaucii TaxID=2043161 RepID=A0A2N9M0T0_9BACT|nr:conserved exported hypothetical protein [Candidatus Sulfotelmatomonas gaucii]